MLEIDPDKTCYFRHESYMVSPPGGGGGFANESGATLSARFIESTAFVKTTTTIHIAERTNSYVLRMEHAVRH